MTKPGDPDNLFPMNDDGSRSTNPDFDQGKTWSQMEKIYKDGKKVKAIGVSNWSIPYLEK